MNAPTPRSTPFAAPEILKLIASFGIVVFHQHASGERIGYAGLPVFTLLTAAFAARSARDRDWASYRRGRLQRLLLPWLAWSLFYVVVQCALATYAGAPTWSWFHPSMLAMGTYPHLWYLPFAAVTTLLVGRFGGHGTTRSWLLGGAIAIPAASWLMTCEPPLPMPQWAFVLPAAVLGTGLARVPLGTGFDRALVACIGAGALGCALTWLTVHDAQLLQYGIAVPVTALAWALPIRAPRWLAAAGAATFGVYVFHPFVGMLLALLAIHGGVVFTEATLLATTFAGSLLITLLLRRTPLRRLL